LKNTCESYPKEVSETGSEKLGPSVIQREGQNQSARFRLRQAATSLKRKLEGRSMERPGTKVGTCRRQQCAQAKNTQSTELYLCMRLENGKKIGIWNSFYCPTRMG